VLRKPVRHATKIIEFRIPKRDGGPQRPDPAPLSGCSRPTMYVLDDYRDNILAAARRGRNYRSIAAQYGINALEVWKIVTDALQVKRAA